MTITGACKFFELSKALFKNGASITVTSGESSKNNLLDFNKTTRWESIGSDDSTTEVLTILFPAYIDLNRLLIPKHNFKDYTITPITSGFIEDNLGNSINDDLGGNIEDDGNTLEFQNVISLFSSTPVSGISETDYAISDSYYEFDSMYCGGLTISITKAQPVNNAYDLEKFCYNVIPTIEIGTFENFPVYGGSVDYNVVSSRTINRKGNINKMLPVFSTGLALMTNSQNDISVVQTLADSTDDFIFWANGGNLTENEADSPYFRYSSKPFRLQDFYQCGIANHNLPTYLNNIFRNQVNLSLSIIETE